MPGASVFPSGWRSSIAWRSIAIATASRTLRVVQRRQRRVHADEGEGQVLPAQHRDPRAGAELLDAIDGQGAQRGAAIQDGVGSLGRHVAARRVEDERVDRGAPHEVFGIRGENQALGRVPPDVTEGTAADRNVLEGVLAVLLHSSRGTAEVWSRASALRSGR